MTRALIVAGVALSMAACSSTNGWWNHGSSRDSANDNGTSMADGTGNMGANQRADNGSSASMNTDQGQGENARSGNVSEQDRQFVQQASEGGMYEVKSSQLALQKTQDARVRMIAQHMIHDHTQANQQLKQTAQQDGLSAASQPGDQQQQMIEQLQKLNGTDFDQQYIQQQTQAHQETIALFQKEASNGQDALRSFAAQTLPTLQQHLQMIRGNGNNNMSSERQ
ncbi:MAG: DUF4142 domain-containing protein [Phycisphaerae bacterium]